jgi:hypothetical protein
VIAMIEKQSATVSRDAQLAMLLRHKWQAEIEKAVDKVKLVLFLSGNERRSISGSGGSGTGR